MRFSLKKQQMIWGYIFISPWLFGAALLFTWPLGRSLLLSLQKLTDVVQLQAEWSGTNNYTEAFVHDVQFLPALLNTVRDLAIDLPLVLVFSLILALLLAPVTRGQTLLRAIFFLPVVIGSPVVISELMRAGGGDLAQIDTAVESFADAAAVTGQVAGIMGPIQLLVERLTVIVWHTGVQILLFIAALRSIPPTLYEAAYVDGATGWEAFWKIALPMLSPVIMVAAVYTLMDSFTDPTNEVVEYIRWVAFAKFRLEYGAALSWTYFIVAFALALLLVALSSRFVFYAGERE